MSLLTVYFNLCGLLEKSTRYLRGNSNLKNHFAHTKGTDQSEWEPLHKHLRGVAERAQQFAHKFEAGDWGKTLGLWHDLGKYSLEFQDYLAKSNNADVHKSETIGRVDHSTAGAVHAEKVFATKPHIGKALAFCIAGHHAGLANAIAVGPPSPLFERLSKAISDFSSAPADLLPGPNLAFRASLNQTFLDHWTKVNCSEDASRNTKVASFSWAFFVRMLFSTLVDADFLATESFMSPAEADRRPSYQSTFASLLECLDEEIQRLSIGRSGLIHSIRQEILSACNLAATQKPGLFSLAVPTGGGKTIASLSFAIRHIIANPNRHFDRVILAIPFTSIIEQTARIYKRIFRSLSEDVVLECHSNVEPKNETDLSRLASQNFDSPIVVTTNVQLFESLFSNRTSRCRKIHNLANSVIVLDEAQTLPIELLQPTLLAIRELVKHYGCTVVLCTATQPSLTFRDEFPIGLKRPHEIVPEGMDLYGRMRRVNVNYIGDVTIESLVSDLSRQNRFLCIQNTRPNATETYKLLQERGGCEGLFLLSTFMCPKHRNKVLREIRRRLNANQTCRVVSTQLIEAGVDVDFPIVYRAIAGLDSIAQAAGRCNREGKLVLGDVRVFRLPQPPPPGILRSTAETTQGLLKQYSDDLIAPEAIEAYFRMHYWRNKSLWDSRKIMEMHVDARKGHIEFADIAKAYQIINDASLRVLIPFGNTGKRLLQRVRNADPIARPLTRIERQEVVRYSISLFENLVLPAIGRDFEYAYDGQFILLLNPSLYDENLGFDVKKIGYIDPGSLVV